MLITKLRSANSVETQQYRKGSKALLVLIPLLGLTYVLVIAGPSKGISKVIFSHIRAVLLSTQVNHRPTNFDAKLIPPQDPLSQLSASRHFNSSNVRKFLASFRTSRHFKFQNARLFSLPTSRTESMVFNRKKIDRQVKSSGCRLMKGQPISVDLSATWRRFTRCRCRFGNSNVFFAHSSQNVALLPTQRPVI